MASNSKKTGPKIIKRPAAPEIPAENTNSEVQIEGGNADFREEIEKSRAMIQNSDKPPETPRNKGGRPSKAEVAAREAAEKEAKARELAASVPPTALKEQVKLPFAMAAMGFGFDGFRLTDEEAEALAPSAHVLLLTYMPQVKPEHVALMSFSSALASIGISKYLAYLAYLREGAGQQSDQVPPPPGQPAPPKASPSPMDGFLTETI